MILASREMVLDHRMLLMLPSPPFPCEHSNYWRKQHYVGCFADAILLSYYVRTRLCVVLRGEKGAITKRIRECSHCCQVVFSLMSPTQPFKSAKAASSSTEGSSVVIYQSASVEGTTGKTFLSHLKRTPIRKCVLGWPTHTVKNVIDVWMLYLAQLGYNNECRYDHISSTGEARGQGELQNCTLAFSCFTKKVQMVRTRWPRIYLLLPSAKKRRGQSNQGDLTEQTRQTRSVNPASVPENNLDTKIDILIHRLNRL